MVASGDYCGPARRAQRGGVEIGVAQPVGSDPVHRGRRNDAAEGGRCAKADVVGEDQQDVRRALRWDDPRRPAYFRIEGVEADFAVKFLRRWRQVAAVHRSGGVGRTRRAGGLLLRFGTGSGHQIYQAHYDDLKLTALRPNSLAISHMCLSFAKCSQELIVHRQARGTKAKTNRASVASDPVAVGKGNLSWLQAQDTPWIFRCPLSKVTGQILYRRRLRNRNLR